jgi:hypothetical protein
MIPESWLLNEHGRPRVDYCDRKSGLLIEVKSDRLTKPDCTSPC